jgi:hypothetical protein
MYKPINGWTKSGIKEHVSLNFRGKSLDKTGMVCSYRGENGKKCAVGLFIRDQDYETSIEGLSIYELIKTNPDLQRSMPLNVNAMALLQRVHDSSEDSTLSISDLLSWIETNVDDN